MKKKVLGLALAGVLTATTVLSPVSFATNAVEKPKETVTEEKTKATTTIVDLKVERIKGDNRYETAIEASKKTFPKGAKYVAIATGEDFVDGLVGGALTSQEGFPLLLTRKKSITKETLDEIKRLKPETIFIFGGEAAVSKEVEAEIAKLEIKIERLAGKNRESTAVMIGDKRMKLNNPEALVPGDSDAFVYGFNFADALTAGPFVGNMARQNVAFYNLGVWINNPNVSVKQMVFGGTAVIPKGTDEKYRFAGDTRYETAVEVAKAYKDVLKMDVDTVILVSGEDFPDGLTAAEIAGEKKAAVLLTNTKKLNATTKKFIEENKNIKNIIILGGQAAVSEAVEKELKEIKVEIPVEKKEEPKEEVKVDSAIQEKIEATVK